MEGQNEKAVGTEAVSSEKSSALTWLQAAERILREEGPEMHIRDLTRRVMDLGRVNSSCTTSLETLLYRQTSKGSSKFVRVPGKMGWFGLRGEGGMEDVKPTLVLPSEKPLVAGVALHQDTEDETLGFEPRVYYKRKRKYSCSSESSSSVSSDSEESSSSCDEEMDALYRKKYNFMKKVAKMMIHENAALSSHLTMIEERIAHAEAERRFLLQKLVKFEKEGRKASSASSKKSTESKKAPPSTVPPLIHIPPHKQSAAAAKGCSVIPVDKKESRAAKSLPAAANGSTQVQNAPINGENPKSLSKGLNDNSKSGPKGLNNNSKSLLKGLSDGPNLVTKGLLVDKRPPEILDTSLTSSERNESDEDFVPSPAVKKGGRGKGVPGSTKEAATPSEGVKSKRSSKVRRLHPIPLHDDGAPIFPIQIGSLKVHTLGKIVSDRAAFHSERYILPVGFQSSRTYPSMKDPSKKCTYTCTIVDGGEAPLFEVIAEDDLDNPVRAASSTACQTSILRAINRARDKQATNSGSGPEFFGYSNPTILNLLQNMPEAKKCTKYKFVRFEEPRKVATKKTITQKPKTSKKAPIKDKGPMSFLELAGFTVSQLLDSKGQKATLPTLVPASDPSLEPVLISGLQQLGMEKANIFSSSDDWSSDSDNEMF